MKLIPSKLHGLADYLAGLFLIISPGLLGFSSEEKSGNIFVILGLCIVGYSTATDYDTGISRAIEFRLHRILDTVAGTILIFSPWLFDFDPVEILPFLLAGIFLISLSLFTASSVEKRAGAVSQIPN